MLKTQKEISSIIGQLEHNLGLLEKVENKSFAHSIITHEGMKVLEARTTPEKQVFDLIPTNGTILASEIEKELGVETTTTGVQIAMENKWIRQQRTNDYDFLIERVVPVVRDVVHDNLKMLCENHQGFQNTDSVSDCEMNVLRERNFVLDVEVVILCGNEKLKSVKIICE
jgi:hypothetical protein